MKPFIMVVDDEPDIRALVKDILEDEGYAVGVAQDGASARNLLRAQSPDLVLLDIWMPDIDGISLLQEWVAAGLKAPVVMVSGHGTVESAVEATRHGAFDFIEKPLSLGKLLQTVQKALAQGRSSKEPARHALTRADFEPVGRSTAMQRLRDQARRVAESSAWLLISGESGSGKETLARYVQQSGPRKDAPFVVATVANFNAARTEELLFGRETAGEIKPGCFEEAQGGVLYLNDIADLDISCQAKLLDVCTTRSFKRVGGARRIEVDVRVIAATRVNLKEAVAAGKFREELYYRIGEIALNLPPLREHVEDIPDLLNHFTDVFVGNEQLPYRKFSLAAQNWLRNYPWPGNVLELRNFVHRLLMLGTTPEIGSQEAETTIIEHAAVAIAAENDGFDLPLREARERFEKSYLEHHLKQSSGNVGLVAKQAGMERTHLYRKFRALGIDTKQIKEYKE
ncbi:MAG: sigma-54-dependent Fis family transcriptional regulator [Gammaproteobacteria bacterium]|nr:sigma-54-dependent Fis family transcriptional regulator [Gammaproteobacteria bacterium]